jgi:hypothetical protein
MFRVPYHLDGSLVIGEDGILPRRSACCIDIQYYLQGKYKALKLCCIHSGGPGLAYVLGLFHVNITNPEQGCHSSCANMTINATSISIDAYCCRLYHVIFLNHILSGLRDIGDGWNPPWWYHMRLVLFKLVKLHLILVF